jgi:predicted dehydrogenase
MAARRPILDIGVCGLGSIGRRHLRVLATRSDVRAHGFDPAFEPTEAERTIVVESSYEDLLTNAADGVIIATPDASHAPLAQQACRAGVAVLVEKPVTDSTPAADDMQRVAEEHGVPVLVGHVLRHAAVVRRARQLLAEAAIGTPVSFHATLGAYETLEVARVRFTEHHPYRLAFDYVHEWDYLQHLLGPIARCAAVAATRGALPLRQDPNVIDAVLELEDGTVGTVHLDYVERHGARTARIVGDRGVLTLDLRGGSLLLAAADGTSRREVHAEERDAIFARQLDHFIDVVRGRAAPSVPISEARCALAVAEAIRAACSEQAWVAVARD